MITATTRDERMTHNRATLTALARRWTLERGFTGFTVDELCEEVGVSRRTFFNYFPSKELAVFGGAEDLDAERTERFAEAGDPSSTALSATLLDDLVALAVPFMDSVEDPLANMREIADIVEQEPRLLQFFIRQLDERDRTIAALVARREGLEQDDPIALFVSRLGGTVVRSALDIFTTPGNSAAFPDILRGLVETARAITLERTL